MSEKEGLPKKGQKKRSISPPIFKDTIRTEIENEISQLMVSFHDMSNYLRMRIEAVLRSEVRDKIRNKKERDFYKTEAENSRIEGDLQFKKIVDPNVFKELYKEKDKKVEELVSENSHLKEKLEKAIEDKLVSDFILGFRSTLHRMEAIYSPKWLLKLDIRHSERWDVIFNLRKDHDDIKVFLNRMAHYHINENVVCTNLDYFLENANIQHHEGDIPDIADKIWPIIFKRLKIRNIDQQNSLKVLLQSIEKSEKEEVWKIQETRKCSRGLVTVKGIPFDWMEKDLLKFVSDFSDSVEQKFLFQSKTDKTKRSGECIIIFQSIEAAACFIQQKDGFKFKDSHVRAKLQPLRE